MHKTSTLIECVERKFLDERQAINLYVVTLGSKLDLLYFLATDDWTYVWFVDAYDTIRNALLGIATLVMLMLPDGISSLSSLFLRVAYRRRFLRRDFLCRVFLTL